MQAVSRRLVGRRLAGGASTYSSSCLRSLYGVSNHATMGSQVLDPRGASTYSSSCLRSLYGISNHGREYNTRNFCSEVNGYIPVKPASVIPSFADIAEVVGPSVVDISLARGFYDVSTSGGSGFLVDHESIITCAHVVGNKSTKSRKKVRVILHDGKRLWGTVLKWAMKEDIAVIKINLAGVKESSYSLAKLGMSQRVRQGDSVCALGSPCGYRNALTTGVISNVNRLDYEIGLKNRGTKFFQTDCAINKGNFGGPLVNVNGEVIGVVKGVKSEDYDGSMVQRIGFVTPIDTVCSLLNLGK